MLYSNLGLITLETSHLTAIVVVRTERHSAHCTDGCSAINKCCNLMRTLGENTFRFKDMNNKDLFDTLDSEQTLPAQQQNPSQNDLFLFDPIKAEDSLQVAHIDPKEETNVEEQTQQSSALSDLNIV